MQGRFTFSKPSPNILRSSMTLPPSSSANELPAKKQLATTGPLESAFKKPLSSNNLGPIQSVTTISRVGEAQTKEIVREVPVFVEKIVDRPVIIEKKVEVPVDRPVFIDKMVHVTREVPITVEKIVERPIEKTVIINRDSPDAHQRIQEGLHKIAELEAENRALRNTYQNKTTIIDTMREKTIKESRIVNDESEVKSLRAKNEMLNQRIAELESAHKQNLVHLTKKSEEIARSTKDIDVLRTSNRQLEAKLKNADGSSNSNTVAALRLEFDSKERQLLNELNKQKLTNSRVLENLSKCQGEIRQLTSELESQRQMNSRAQSQLMNEKLASEKLKSHLEGEKAKATLEVQLSKQYEERLMSVQEHSDQQKAALQKKINEMSQQLSSMVALEQSCLSLQHRNRLLENDVQSLNHRIALLTQTQQADSNKEHSEKQKLASQLIKAQEELQIVAAQKINAEEAHKAEVRSIESKQSAVIRDLERHVEDLNVSLSSQQHTFNRQYQELLQQNAELQKKVMSLESQSIIAQQEIQNQQSKVEKLESERLDLYQRLSHRTIKHEQPMARAEPNYLIASTAYNEVTQEADALDDLNVFEGKRDSVDTTDNLKLSATLKNNHRNEIEMLMRNNMITLERQLSEAMSQVKAYKAKNSKLKQSHMFTNFRLVSVLSEFERLCRSRHSSAEA